MNRFKKKLPLGCTLITPAHGRPSARALAYAAGFTDGEGCIQIIRQQLHGRPNPTYRLRLEVIQNDYDTLVHFVHCVGVPVVVRPVKRQLDHSRQIWRVLYDGPQAYQAIRYLRRHLVRKRSEANVAIEFVRKGRIDLHPGPKGTPPHIWAKREQCFQELRSLKRLPAAWVTPK